MERFVVADRGLPADVVPKFEAYARDRTTELLVDLDNWLTPYSATGVSEAVTRVPTGINIFLYVEPPGDERPLKTLVQDGRPFKEQ
jgi:hypothetical protein